MYIKHKKDIIIFVLALIVVLQALFIIYVWPKKIKPRLPELAKVAIVIDDWGYNLRYIKLLEGLNLPLNLAILPNLPYSKQTANIARQNNWQVILHLPLEPERNPLVRLEKDTILTDMSESQIRDILDKAAKTVPGACGISNHMGSRATKDIKTMTTIFKWMKKNNLYFLDSLVTIHSVCFGLAKKQGLAYKPRDVFLDNQENPDYIRDKIEELIDIAKQNQRAVGVCHNQKTTLEILKQELPKFKHRGIDLVFVSDILR